MNEIPNQFSVSRIGRISCFALGLALAFACQKSAGQSAPASPKIPLKIARLQAELEELKQIKDDFPALIKAEEAKEKSYLEELQELAKRETKLRVSAESYPEILRTIHSQRVQLSIDLAGIDARYHALVKAIARATEDHRREVSNQPYQRLVEVREADLKRRQGLLQKGQMPMKEVQNAEVELLEARLRLAEASKPSASVAYLNSQLLDTSLERAEKDARLVRATSILDDVEEYRTFRKTLDETERKYVQAHEQLEKVLKKQASNDRTIAQYEEKLAWYKKEIAEGAE